MSTTLRDQTLIEALIKRKKNVELENALTNDDTDSYAYLVRIIMKKANICCNSFGLQQETDEIGAEATKRFLEKDETSLREIENLETYLFGVVRNTAVDFLKKRKKESKDMVYEEHLPEIEDELSSDQALKTAKLKELAMAKLPTIDPLIYQLALLYHGPELTYLEIMVLLDGAIPKELPIEEKQRLPRLTASDKIDLIIERNALAREKKDKFKQSRGFNNDILFSILKMLFPELKEKEIEIRLNESVENSISDSIERKLNDSFSKERLDKLDGAIRSAKCNAFNKFSKKILADPHYVNFH